VHVVLATLGTAGDVQPFVAIGKHLRAHGHRVELLSNPVFAELAAEAGLEFTPVGSAEDHRATFSHHFTWHAVNGFGVMWRYLARPAIPQALARLEALRGERGLVVLYSPFLMPAPRIAQEDWGLRAVSAWTAPAMVPNLQPPLCVTSLRIPAWVPGVLAAAAVRALDRRKMQPLARPAVESARSSRGLPPLDRSIFLDWLHSPLLSLALFPDWFAAATPDWPRPHCHAGFPFYAGEDSALPDSLETFLREGEAPVVITAGTAMRGARRYFETAIDACASLGLRAVLLAREPGEVPEALPPFAIHARWAPLVTLLPRTRAILHHGGIGTLAEALRAGVPQLVLPRAYDQFDNAMRLEQLGVGMQLDPQNLRAARLAVALHRLLRPGTVDSAAKRIAAHVDPQPAAERVRLALEGLA
jgi:rhamnosyltransferase subunit B